MGEPGFGLCENGLVAVPCVPMTLSWWLQHYLSVIHWIFMCKPSIDSVFPQQV